MLQLKTAINVVELIISFVAILLLGDYLGYKIGRWRLALFAGVVALVTIILYAIYSAVALA